MSVRVRVTMKKAADAAFLSGSLLEGQRAELSSDGSGWHAPARDA